MAKGGSNTGVGGGILGSGIFGIFGTTIRCDSKDDSTYCNIMKIFNMLIVFFVVIYILYIVYGFFISPAMKKRR
jgi:hypothetical protein